MGFEPTTVGLRNRCSTPELLRRVARPDDPSASTAPPNAHADRAPALVAQCEARIAEANAYAHEHYEDQPEIRDWVWTD